MENAGMGNDHYIVEDIAKGTPEIVNFQGEYYIAALNPTLDGIRITKLQSLIDKSLQKLSMADSLFSSKKSEMNMVPKEYTRSINQ